MFRKQIILICLIAYISCGIWQEVEPIQFVSPFTHSAAASWTAIPNHSNLVTECNGKSVLGGYGLFSQGQKLQKQYLGLPYFVKIKIRLTLYQIDSWDQSHQHGFDEFQILINGVEVHDVIKASGYNGGTPLCGAGWNDDVVQVSYEGVHVGTSFMLTFTDTLNQNSKDESWGIQNLEIQIYLECEPPKVQFGSLCLSRDELQQCHDLLGQLDDSDLNNSSVDNFCEPEVVNDEQTYNFSIVYNPPFKLDPKCLTQTIEVESVLLNKGPGPYDEWQFDPSNQTTKFKLKHKDLVPKYGCDYITTPTQYIWVCDIHLKIYLGGVEQFHYQFQLKIYLSRIYKNRLLVNVTKNIVVGDCCENKLNIKTELKFCVDFTCNAYLPSPLTIKRKQSFFVEHSIVTPEFKYYYLHGVSVTLGPFLPTIVQHNGSQKGRLIYELKSNIAINGLTLTVISKLAEVPSRLLRLLEAAEGENQVGNSYNVKAEGQGITIEEEEIGDPNNAEKNDNTALIAAVSVIGVISLLTFGGTTFYCLRLRKRNIAQKYQDQDVKQSEENDMEEAYNK